MAELLRTDELPDERVTRTGMSTALAQPSKNPRAITIQTWTSSGAARMASNPAKTAIAV